MDDGLKQKLEELLHVFRSLNPELVYLIRRELTETCKQIGPEAFDLVMPVAEEIVSNYLDSPVKNAERALLKQYYYFLDRTSKRMIAEGELPELEPSPVQSSVALVPEHYYTSVQWLQVQTQSHVPPAIANAVDAAQRRNLLVESVLEPMFELQLAVDYDRAFEWQMTLCGKDDDPVDPDIARDLLRAWDKQGSVPDQAIRQALHWGSDEVILRHWPTVIQEADRLTRKHALIGWSTDEHRLRQAVLLQKQAPFDDEDRLLSWLKSSISKMGDSIEFFCAQSEALVEAGDNTDDREWRQDAMFREVSWLSHMMPPMLLLADLLLPQPDGSFEFAMSFFGFTVNYRLVWREKLLEQCVKAVNRHILRDLRLKRLPSETIHSLSFGDEKFEENLIKELDLATGNFDSIQQKNVVVGHLAHMYASYREPPLLAQEIARRYRRMMRVLHEDSLARSLRPDQIELLGESRRVLTDLSTMAADCRRFLSMRRALEKSTEEIIAADIDFSKNIRSLRATYVNLLLRLP